MVFMPDQGHWGAPRSHHGGWRRRCWMELECTLGQQKQLNLQHQSSRLLAIVPGSEVPFGQKHPDIELSRLESISLHPSLSRKPSCLTCLQTHWSSPCHGCLSRWTPIHHTDVVFNHRSCLLSASASMEIIEAILLYLLRIWFKSNLTS